MAAATACRPLDGPTDRLRMSQAPVGRPPQCAACALLAASLQRKASRERSRRRGKRQPRPKGGAGEGKGEGGEGVGGRPAT